MTTREPARRSPLRRFLLPAGIVVLLVGGLVLALSEMLRLALPRLLASQELEGSVERVELGLWNGELALLGLRVGTPEGLVLRFAKLEAAFDTGALLSGDPSALKRLSVSGGELDTDRLAHKDWGDGEGDTDLRSIRVPRVAVDDVALNYVSRLLGRDVRVRRLSLAPSDQGSGPVAVLIDLAVDQGGVLLEGYLTLDADTPSLTAELTVQGLDLEGLAPLTGGALARLSGQVDGAGRVLAGMDPETGVMRVSLQGQQRVAGLTLGRDDLDAEVSAGFDGVLSAAWPVPGAAPLLSAQGILSSTALRSRWQGEGVVVEVAGEELGWEGELVLGPAGPRGAGALDWSRGRLALDGEFTPALITLLGRLASVGDEVQARLGGERRPLDVTLSDVAAQLELGGAFEAPVGDAPQPVLDVQRLSVKQVTLAGREGLPPANGLGMLSENLRFFPDGAISADLIKSSTLEGRLPGEAPAWQAQEIALEGVARAADGLTTWRRARIGQVTARAPAGVISVEGIGATALRQSNESGVSLQSVSLDRAVLPFPEQGLVLESAVLESLMMGVEGGMTAASVKAAALALGPDSATPTRLEALALTGLSMQPDLRLAAESLALGRARVGLSQAVVAVEQAQGAGAAVSAQGAVTVAGINAKIVSAKGTQAPWQSAVEGLAAQDLALALPESISLGSLEISGLSYEESGNDRVAAATASVKGVQVRGAEASREVQVSDVSMTRVTGVGADGGPLLAVDSVQIAQLSLGANASVKVGRLEAAGARAGREGESRVAFQALTLEALKTGEAGLVSLGTGTLEGLDADLARAKDGALSTPVLPFLKPAQAASGSDEDTKPLALVVTRFQTEGSARLGFTDRSVAPPFVVEATDLGITVEKLDTRAASAGGRVAVNGALSKFSSIKLAGEQRAEGGQRVTDFDGRIRGADLKKLTPYAQSFKDARIRKGRADLRMKGVVRGNIMKADMDVVLSKLELESVARAPAKTDAGTGAKNSASGGGGGLPLATALALLRDDEGTIRLKVPVSGRLDQPDFDLSDAVGQAVAKAARGAAMLVFQPVGILVTAASALTGLSGGLGAEPVVFAVGEAEIPADGLTRLDALAEILKGKPSVAMFVCGRAGPEDVAALAAGDEAALALARTRGETVRAYLAQHDVPAGQLRPCDARLEPAGTAGLPRVDIALELPGLPAAKPARAKGPER